MNVSHFFGTIVKCKNCIHTKDHVAELGLVPRLELHLDQLVDGLLVVERALDGEVRDTSELKVQY